MSRNVRKRTFWHICQTKTQSNLHSLVKVFVVRMNKLCIHGYQNASSGNSDQTTQMRRLILIFAGCTCPLVYFWCWGSHISAHSCPIASSHVRDFNDRYKLLSAKVIKQDIGVKYYIHFLHLIINVLNEFLNIMLAWKQRTEQSVSELEFSNVLLYKLRRAVWKTFCLINNIISQCLFGIK